MLTGIFPVEYTTMLGPPAIGNMNAKEEAKQTARRYVTGSYPWRREGVANAAKLQLLRGCHMR